MSSCVISRSIGPSNSSAGRLQAFYSPLQTSWASPHKHIAAKPTRTVRPAIIVNARKSRHCQVSPHAKVVESKSHHCMQPAMSIRGRTSRSCMGNPHAAAASDTPTSTWDLEWDVEWLARFQPFSWLSLPALSELVASASVVSVAAGTSLATQGERITDLIIVREGLLVVQEQQQEAAGPSSLHGKPRSHSNRDAEGAPSSNSRSPSPHQPGLLGAGSTLFFSEIVLASTAGSSKALASSPWLRASTSSRSPSGSPAKSPPARASLAFMSSHASFASMDEASGSVLSGQLMSDATYVAHTHVQLWCIPVQVARSLVRARQEEYALALSRSIASTLQTAQAHLAASRLRERELAPYLVAAPERSVIGQSAYADRLRKQLLQAARDPDGKQVMLFGEPGNFKANLAALIHFGSNTRGAPMVRLACERLDATGSELFGRGSKQGLLSLLQASPPGSTLLLDDVHKAPPSLLPALRQLLMQRSWRAAAPAAGITVGAKPQALQVAGNVRVIMTAARSVPILESACTVIKVPPLRIRTADIPTLASHYLAVAARGYTGNGVHIMAPRTAAQSGRPGSPSIICGTATAVSGSSPQAARASLDGAPMPAKKVRWVLSPEAVRRLQAYSWPGNEKELASTIARAAAQYAAGLSEDSSLCSNAASSATASTTNNEGVLADLLQSLTLTNSSGGSAGKATSTGQTASSTGTANAAAHNIPPVVEVQQLPEELVWFGAVGPARELLRIDVLSLVPQLRALLRSDLWPEAINFKFTAYAFPIIVAMLLWGPQDRDHNAVLNVFWCWWWPTIYLTYPLLGRVWCAVCPFMIYGELVQRARVAMGATLLKWPRQSLDSWGPWFLFSLFAAILVWEECWDLPHTAALSGWLLIAITAGAMICSALFERRLWCRYLCPIGGMNGMMAKASMLELRARQGVCAGNCDTYHCYKGGPEQPPEGLDTMGCPLYSHPARLTDNRNCTLCMTCLKACPNRSIELRLRPPLADLWDGSHEPMLPELALMALLGGAVPLHTSALLMMQLGLDPNLFATGPTPLHIALSLAVLAAPAVLITAADQMGRRACREAGAPLPAPLLSLGYAYMPLVWGGTLAYYEHPLLSEAGRVFQVAVAMAGGAGWQHMIPYVAAHPAVITFLQGATLLVSAVCSMVLVRRIGAAPWTSLSPHVTLIALTTLELWALIVRQ